VTVEVGGPAGAGPEIDPEFGPGDLGPPARALHRRRNNGPARRRAVVGSFVCAAGGYLLVSIVLWWHVWTTHPSTTATCGCGDPALFTWFLEWPAYAIDHGANLFFSTALFHPSGFNLLANTSVLAIGVPLAPITWAFGPIATLNVASTLVPVATALSAFWLLRRWVRWTPAAFVGGLLYGFSPFVLQGLADAHLMTAALAVLPLMLGCLDELLIRQRRRAIPVGVALGLLVCVEFFVSTEVLVIVALASVIGVVLLIVYAAIADRADLPARVRRAAPGVVAAGVVTVALLAYPAWFALAGPAHLSGEIWPHIPVIGGYTPRSFIDPGFGARRSILLDIGGYLGRPLPSSSYIGWGMLAVLAASLVIWRRDRRLWFFGALAVVTALLSLGERKHQWVPWQLFDRTPVLDNVVEQRFMAVTYLALAVMLAVVLDRARWVTLPRRSGRAGAPAVVRSGVRVVAVLVAAGVSLVPLVQAVAPSLPYAVRPVDLPTWFAVQGPKVAPGQVLLAYPPPFSGIQSALAWQAINGMRYGQAGGGGPQGTPGRAGRERPGFLVLASVAFGFTPPPAGTRREVAAVRQALSAWEVTMVVIPDRSGVPSFVGHDAHYAAGFMTAVLGRGPVYQDHAWVWSDVGLAPPGLRIDADTLSVCTAFGERHRRSPGAVPACVIRAAAEQKAAPAAGGTGATTPFAPAP